MPACGSIRACHRGLPQRHPRGGHPRQVLPTQNDGTLMDASFAEKFPVLTLRPALPTTCAARPSCWRQRGDRRRYRRHHVRCRLAAQGFSTPGDCRCRSRRCANHFRMPDVFSIGLGGGSHVVETDHGVKVGPVSVGYRIKTEALIFGGETLTTTDVTVAAGKAELGDASRVAHLGKDMLERVQAKSMTCWRTASRNRGCPPIPCR